MRNFDPICWARGSYAYRLFCIKDFDAEEGYEARVIRWVIFLQEFYFDVKYRKGTENQVADHLSRLEHEAIRKLGEKAKIDDVFPDEHILASL